jgi:hypothetical protein
MKACFLFLFISMTVEARLYFLHIPKTGGTTLRLLLEQELSSDEIYPFRNSKSAKSPVQEELVSGHFLYAFCKKLDPNFDQAFKVTILRDPIERYLSFLRAKKKADESLPDLESVLKLRLIPNGKYHQGLIDNALCRQLAVNPHLRGQALLESAKKTLHTLDCVIFFDHFEEEVIDLFARLGILKHRQDIPKLNTTEKEPVSIQILEEVKNWNALDIELYAYAKKHLGKKTGTYPLKTKSFHPQEKISEVEYTFDLPLTGRGWTYRDIAQHNVIHRWVMDQPAYIYFSIEEGFDYDLFFNAKCLTEEVVPQIRVNGKEIEIKKLDEEDFSLYLGKIPKEFLTNGPIELCFYSNKAFLYRDFYPTKYNRNHPLLSFALSKIRISKAT